MNDNVWLAIAVAELVALVAACLGCVWFKTERDWFRREVRYCAERLSGQQRQCNDWERRAYSAESKLAKINVVVADKANQGGER